MRFFVSALVVFLLAGPALANSRQPCDRGAGGISHCQGDKFVCNDGRISGSKRKCSADVYSGSPAKGSGAAEGGRGGAKKSHKGAR